MKKIQLSKEEREIAQSIERGEFVPVTGAELDEVVAAIEARKKDMTITIRVNGNDIARIKERSQKLGIKYQTYLAEIIHRIAEHT
ncbi:MAG: hypothetical protein KKH94_09520 [Candidatus Omnitrophica bacterium]|nr:hypothetical protein [Candidatus Omnitrophota bacterium]